MQLLSLAAVLAGNGLRVDRRSKDEKFRTWADGLLLAGGIGLLAVACAHALDSDVPSAILWGSIGALFLVGVARDWRRSSAAGFSQGH